MVRIEHLLSCSTNELWNNRRSFSEPFHKGKYSYSTSHLVITTDKGQWIIRKHPTFAWRKRQGQGHGLIHRHLNSREFHSQWQSDGRGIDTVELLLEYIIKHDYMPARQRSTYNTPSDGVVHIHHMDGKISEVILAAKKLDIIHNKPIMGPAN